MANKVEGYTFVKPRSKYPWDEWTDGDQWQIYKDEDYHISTYNMQISLHGRAKMQGLKVKSNSFVEHEGFDRREGLIFQFELGDEYGNETQSREA